MATTQDNNMEWASSWTRPKSSQSSAAHRFPTELLQFASQPRKKEHHITIMQIYAPTSTYDDDLVEAFYEQLERTIKEIPRKDLIIIQGNWTDKVGPDAYEQWVETEWCLEPEKPKRGDFWNSNTGIRWPWWILFPHMMSRRTTWYSPDGVT